MFVLIGGGLFGVLVLIVAAIAMKVNWKKYKDRKYFEVTLFLGSGGHTGELCQLLNNFKLERVDKLNVLITSSDKSS